MEPDALKQHLLCWYDTARARPERDAAARAAVAALLPHLHLPAALRRIDGVQEQDLVQDVLRVLFDPARRHLADVPAPKIVAYAREALRRRALSVIRVAIGRREADPHEIALAVGIEPGSEAPSDQAVRRFEILRDLPRMLHRLDALAWEDRMAVLLTTCPDRISDEDWLRLVPGGGLRPGEALSREEASRLLRPPDRAEDAAARRRRHDWLQKRLDRALAKLLALDEEGAR